jgi:DNA-binding SARP family transcriptional activator
MHIAAARADLKAAIGHGRRILAEDPLRESMHREVMRLCLRDGQRAEALRQFAECRRILDHELQVEPMPETLALYRELSGAAPASAARASRAAACWTRWTICRRPSPSCAAPRMN